MTSVSVRTVTKMVKQEWVAVTGPYPCRCGHDHHGRELYENGHLSHLAPQYGLCDDPDCVCDSLARVGT
jgi:hypothetical protein